MYFATTGGALCLCKMRGVYIWYKERQETSGFEIDEGEDSTRGEAVVVVLFRLSRAMFVTIL